jgi:hypothetical protein
MKTGAEKPLYVPVRVVAEKLQVSTSWVYAAINERAIPAIRLQGTIRIPALWLEGLARTSERECNVGPELRPSQVVTK